MVKEINIDLVGWTRNTRFHKTCLKNRKRKINDLRVVILTYNVKCERQAKQNVHQLSDCFIPLGTVVQFENSFQMRKDDYKGLVTIAFPQLFELQVCYDRIARI